MYIDSPVEGSVCIGLWVPKRVGWMVGVVLTPDFRQKHLLSEVTVRIWKKERVKNRTQHLVRNSIYVRSVALLALHTFMPGNKWWLSVDFL